MKMSRAKVQILELKPGFQKRLLQGQMYDLVFVRNLGFEELHPAFAVKGLANTILQHLSKAF